jgi:hypothetical protein
MHFIISVNGEVYIKMLSEVKLFIKTWQEILYFNYVNLLFLHPYRPEVRQARQSFFWNAEISLYIGSMTYHQ